MRCSQKLQNRMSARKIHLGGTGDRLKNIRFCLVEAESEKDTDFMNSVAAMALLRDEGHGILLLALGSWRSDGVPWESYGTILRPQIIW